MILSWMAYASLSAALCAIAAACIDSALRHRLRRRRLVWMVAMLASVVLPLVIPLLAQARANVSANASQLAQSGVTGSVAAAPSTVTPRDVDWGTLAVVVWIASSSLLAISLIASSARMSRRMRRYRRARVDGHSLLVSDDFGPAVVGLLHPIIVLPKWAFYLTDAERRLVVAHEIEHQRAADPALSVTALFLVALFPWNAALWWQLSRLRLAIEFDCDARVVTQNGADPFAYGNLLVTAHENAGHSRLAALGMAPMRSALGQRINALVATGSQSWRRTCGAVGVAVIALSALGFAPVPVLPRLPASVHPQQRRLASTGADTQAPHMRATLPDSLTAGTMTLSKATNSPGQTRTRMRDTIPPAAGTYSMQPRATPVPTFGAMRRLDSGAATVAPDSSTYTMHPSGGNYGTPSGAVMRQSGGAGGSIIKRQPLKTYAGGFMNAEVPARADSATPPVR